MGKLTAQEKNLAFAAAMLNVIDGTIALELHEGHLGVWCEHPEETFFLNFAALADKSFYSGKDSKPEDHMIVWMDAGPGKRPIQLRIDPSNNKVINSKEALSKIESEEKEGGEVELICIENDGEFVYLSHDIDTGRILNYVEFQEFIESASLDIELSEGAPPKQLQDGDRWVTIKPHGPDHPDYRRVIIRPRSDGTATIVWAGNKGLTHLKLNRVGTKKEIDEAEKKKAVPLTPEAAKAEKEKQDQRREKLEENRQSMGKAVLKAIGLPDHDADSFLKAFETTFKPVPTEKPEKVDKPGAEKEERQKLEDLANGDTPENAPAIDQPSDLPTALAEEYLADITGIPPKPLGGSVDPELAKAWDKVRSNEDTDLTKAVNAILETRRKADSKIKREARKEGGVKTLNTSGFYSDPDEMTKNLLDTAREKFEYQARSGFYKKIDTLSNAAKYHDQGMADGLSHALQSFGTHGKLLDARTVDLFSPEIMAEVIANHIRQNGSTDEALGNLEKSFVEKEFPTVQEALARSEELTEERKRVASDALAGNILKSASSRALAEATIEEKKHLARAAGSLESMALVLDSLRQKKQRAIRIDAGGRMGTILHYFDRTGMQEGADYNLLEQGGRTVIDIKPESSEKLLKVIGKGAVLDKQRALIKSHQANTSDFFVPGMNKDFRGTGALKLTDEQQAAIRMFEHEGKTFGNLSVGIGKTITYGAAHARLQAQAEEKGEPSHGWFIVPSKLMDESVNGLKEAFPDMDIVSVGGKDKRSRPKIYGEKHGLTLISSDLVREDADFLAKMVEGGHGPAAIYGDEVHEMFTPTESEDASKQSQRSLALMKLTAPRSLVMTGTPFRKSLSEIHQVISWQHQGTSHDPESPEVGPLGSRSAFMKAFGSIGQGTTAWEDSQYSALRDKLDPYTITEKAVPLDDKGEVVPHLEHKHLIRPTEEQFGKIREAYGKHKERIDSGKVKPSVSSGRLSSEVSEIMSAGNAENNPSLKEVHGIISKYASDGKVGIIHCLSTKAMFSVAKMYPQGEVLPIYSKTTQMERQHIKQAINTGLPCEGMRVSVGSTLKMQRGGEEGIVTKVQRDLGGKKESPENIGIPVNVTVKFENGTESDFPVAAVKSLLKGMAGTSVTATGLNLQGADYNIHLEAADTAATRTQRNARPYRKGRKKEVNSHYIISDTPTGRKKERTLQKQDKAQKAIDDPMRYERLRDPVYRQKFLQDQGQEDIDDSGGMSDAA